MMPSDTAPAPAPRPRPHGIRRTLVAIGLAGALAAGGGAAFPAAAAAAEGPGGARAPQALLGWCPFGSYPDGGCRGGGIDDNERLNDSLADTGRMYRDAGGCAAESVAKSLKKNRKRLSLPGVALGTVSPALRCGSERGY